jgi:uncharacterized protein
MIIDTHTHLLDGNWLSDYPGCPTAEELIDAQDRFGVKEMWMSSVGALAEDFVYYNQQLYQITKNFPERFKNFATASSYFGDKAVNEIRKCLNDYGFKGIKVHYWMQGGLVHSETSRKIMELSIEFQVPVLFHDGTPPTSDTLQIAYLADLYPEAKIILGHSGMLDSFRSAIVACNTHQNIYLCISASPIADVREICKNAKHDRLLFGSDYGAGPTDDIFWDRYHAIEYGCEDLELKDKIFFNNARELMAG